MAPEVHGGGPGLPPRGPAPRRRTTSSGPEQFPFVHSIVDEFADHDDREQFLAALDLTLAGLSLQAGG